MRDFPKCFDSYDHYAKWRAEAVKERDAAWEAWCSENGVDPDSVLVKSRRVYPIAFQLATICEDCTPEYQKRMTCAGRCERPHEIIAKPTNFEGIAEVVHGPDA